jgi:hypothetical protein
MLVCCVLFGSFRLACLFIPVRMVFMLLHISSSLLFRGLFLRILPVKKIKDNYFHCQKKLLTNKNNLGECRAICYIFFWLNTKPEKKGCRFYPYRNNKK